MEREHFSCEVLFERHIILYDSKNAKVLAVGEKDGAVLFLTKACVFNSRREMEMLFIEEHWRYAKNVSIVNTDEACVFFCNSVMRSVSIEDSGIFQETMQLKELK